MDCPTQRGLQDPIQIKPGSPGRLIVRVPYSIDHVAKIKTVQGRRWHQSEQCWTTPHTDSALSHLTTLFAGEPVEVDPSLRVTNDTQREAFAGITAVRFTVPTDPTILDRVRKATRTRHLSHHTEQAYCHWIKRLLPIGLTPKDTTSRRAWVLGCLPPHYPWGIRSQPDRQ